MNKYKRLKKASNISICIAIGFVVIAFTGAVGDVIYRLSGQMWAIGRARALIVMMIGSFGGAITCGITVVLLWLQRRVLTKEMKRLNAESELFAELLEEAIKKLNEEDCARQSNAKAQ